MLEVPMLSPRDSLAAIASSAVVVHLIFKRWEPKRIPIVCALLLLVPSLLSTLLVPHDMLVKGVVLTFFIFWTTLIASIILYRISPFHPLARYPGPLPARVTKLWHTWHVLGGKQHLYIQGLHDKYGDAVRIGPNELSLRDPSCVTPLYGSQGVPRSDMFYGRNMWPSIPPMIGCMDPAEHLHRRRPWNRAFNINAVKEFQPVIGNRVQGLVEALTLRSGEVVDLTQWISYFTYDFMGDIMFGGWTEMVRDGGDKDGLWAIIRKGLNVGAVYEHIPWLSWYTKHIPGAGEDLKQMRNMAMARAGKRYESGSTSRDLFYYLSNEDGAEKESRPRAYVIADALLAVVAGSDTTALVLTCLFFSLMRNPEVYARLQAEVDKFYPPGENALDPRHQKDMPYLEAVINETLRMYPAVPGGSGRATQGEGRVIGPYYIPPRTKLRLHFWSLHRDPRNFSHPDTFWPERWLAAEGAIGPDGAVKDLVFEGKPLTHNLMAFIPFSTGPSNCVGKNLAMQEMRTFICCFVQRFHVRFSDAYDPARFEESMEDKFVTKLGELPCMLERRD